MSGSEEASLRKSNKEAAETRRAIVAAAADYIRRTGIAEASLSDVMAAAGLTHGGFYKHFRNREQLIAEALVAAGNASADMLGKVRAEKGRNAALDRYLSPEHRDAGTPTCPMAALGSEAARSSGKTRAAAVAVVEEMIDALAEDRFSGEARGEAMVDYATMIGAMTLARIASGTPLSEEILERARKRLRR
ncbi:TetR family transcriptional regulator [Mesorhizobium sp. M7A.F.Ca.CA.001.09.2.1]|nr:TetR family transcriptional regulator [Mesorhizobium sp. M7A.F.Ca.CA.001.13.2.1]RUY62275.1 TetR family transcriptional regulator [Mesorhizobium sp. M7A.F.Ca.CA.001.05.1.1]RUY72902.1 TetR family transcriptional regulator [Mesorhizobium sp. M7A.F.Ca.CA.001.13.1.1]RUY79732.1 TetR family transcriptional regulator [Mesorhizobium sp. M7A.F.Ca.CA.001.09.2.1]RUZ10432.1 TetR family transcriptional regulator [Mesorhizobium sp. M7A.F.Ca.CA.001.04.2.1]RUZ17065.1 TetR family transcriptional regulator [M